MTDQFPGPIESVITLEAGRGWDMGSVSLTPMSRVRTLDEENMDWSPETNYHYEVLETPNRLISPQCDVTRRQTNEFFFFFFGGGGFLFLSY